MNTPSPDQQTDAGKSPGQTAVEAYSGFPIKNYQYLSMKPIWEQVAQAVLAKHMLQVTAEDVGAWFAQMKAGQGHESCAKFINARLRSRIVPEAAEVEWEEFEPWKVTVQKGDEQEHGVPAGKWTPVLDVYCGQTCPLQVRRRKKQAESPTQDKCHAPDITVCEQKPAHDSTDANAGRPSEETASTVTPNIALTSKSGGESGSSGEGGNSNQPPQVAGDGVSPTEAKGGTPESSYKIAWEDFAKHIDRASRLLPAEVLGKNVLEGACITIEALKADESRLNKLANGWMSSDFAARKELTAARADAGRYSNDCLRLNDKLVEAQRELTAYHEKVAELERTTTEAIAEWRGVNAQLTTAQKERDEAIANCGAEALKCLSQQQGIDEKDAEIARLKEEVVQSNNIRGNVISERNDLHEKLALATEELATLRTAPAKGLTGKDVSKAFQKLTTNHNYAAIADDLNAILSAQPVSPWRDAKTDPPTNGEKYFVFFGAFYQGTNNNGGFSSGTWEERASLDTHYMVIPNLPLPVVVEDEETKAWKTHQASESRPCNERDFRAGFVSALSTKTGGAA